MRLSFTVHRFVSLRNSIGCSSAPDGTPVFGPASFANADLKIGVGEYFL
jgi:hypothetical protein